MRTIGTAGEYTLIEDGMWMGTIDKEGKMHILPDMQYRSIYDFVDGIAIAFQNEKWGLIDTEGNHISEFKYNFVEPAGEGYYKAEIGAKKNLLRRDGTEVLSVWLNDVYKVENGFFQIGITQRKTKTTPTKYLHGIAHVSGNIIFPVIFDNIQWADNKKHDLFYAELDGKPYILTPDGSIYDPDQSHLPKKLSIDAEGLIEKFMNWTLPGLQFFYRDTDAPVIVDTTYHVGDIIRAGFFIDATTKLLKPNRKTRFIIASAHAAMLCEIDDMVQHNPDVKKWNLCVFHFNSYFKVMDVYKRDGVSQVLLLHIPKSAAIFLGNNETALNFVNEAVGEGRTLVEMARKSLDEKMEMDIHSRSIDKTWEERTYHPIGLDDEFYPLPLSPVEEPVDEETAAMSSFVHKIAKDADIEGFIMEEDRFPWRGIKGHICEKCIYAKSITDKAEGCGRLFQKSFRDRYLRGHCEYWKDSLARASDFENKKQREQIEAKDKLEKESDIYALRLLNDFIAEKLGGDIEKLANFDFSKLKDDEKFGNCDGYAFSTDRCRIVKAILALCFSKAWPELTYETIDKHKYSGDIINIVSTVFGITYEDYFKALERFPVSDATLERIKRFRDMSNTIGNIMVLPSGLCLMRNTKPLGRGYTDVFLNAFYKMMINAKKCNMKVLDALNFKKKELIAYRTEANYHNTVKELMLEDFVDENGTPQKVFKGIFSWEPTVDKDAYYESVEEYLTFCESFIPRRAERMIDKLKLIIKNN